MDTNRLGKIVYRIRKYLSKEAIFKLKVAR